MTAAKGHAVWLVRAAAMLNIRRNALFLLFFLPFFHLTSFVFDSFTFFIPSWSGVILIFNVVSTHTVTRIVYISHFDTRCWKRHAFES